MMDHETFKSVEGYISAAAAKLDGIELFMPAVTLPGNAVVHCIEHLLERPVSMRGVFETHALCSFHAYVKNNRGGDMAVFVDRDNMTAVAIVDHGNHSEELAGWGKHKAIISPKITPEYKALLENSRMKGKKFSQRDFADWINDWKHCLAFFEKNDQGVEQAMDIGRAIQAVQKIDVKKLSNAGSEEGNFHAKRTRMEEIAIGGEIKLPERMVMKCDPYVGFKSREFACRVVAFWDDQNVSLGYRIDGHEHDTDDISDEFQDKVMDSPDMNDLPVYRGTFTRGK